MDNTSPSNVSVEVVQKWKGLVRLPPAGGETSEGLKGNLSMREYQRWGTVPRDETKLGSL